MLNWFRHLIETNELTSFAKVMKLVLGASIWGKGGFSLPKLGRLKSPLPMRKRLSVPLFIRSSIIDPEMTHETSSGHGSG
jgi:hypothetical protein